MRSLARKITGALICLICFVLLARASFYRDPGSVFFDESRAYEKEYSQHRIKEVEHFVASFDTSNKEPAEPHPKRPSGPDLCISIASVKRNDMQYIEVRVLPTTSRSMTNGSRLQLEVFLKVSLPTSERTCILHC